MALNEADTCRVHITPKLREVGWEQTPHSLNEQKIFTDGRVFTTGGVIRRGPQKRADYLLRYTRDFSIAVVEAKPEDTPAGDGLQQAKEYAEILGLKFAYATNGREIVEFDYTTGLERMLSVFPSPSELWSRLKAAEGMPDDAAKRLLTPSNTTSSPTPHYYQEIAINRAVQAILQGKPRAPGTRRARGAAMHVWCYQHQSEKEEGRPGTNAVAGSLAASLSTASASTLLILPPDPPGDAPTRARWLGSRVQRTATT
jgi:type I restriction enzyme, R subunit